MSRRNWVVMGVVVLAAAAIAAPVLAAVWVAEDNDEKVPLKDLPKNVVAVVKAVCPGGQLLSAEKEPDRKTGGIEYDVKVKQADGKVVEVEVVVDKSGNVRKVQVGEDDDDDKDADNEDDDKDED